MASSDLLILVDAFAQGWPFPRLPIYPKRQHSSPLDDNRTLRARRVDTCRFVLRHVSGAFRVTITLQQDVQFSNQYPIREAINSRDRHGERIGGHPRKDEEAEDWTNDMNSRELTALI